MWRSGWGTSLRDGPGVGGGAEVNQRLFCVTTLLSTIWALKQLGSEIIGNSVTNANMIVLLKVQFGSIKEILDKINEHRKYRQNNLSNHLI